VNNIRPPENKLLKIFDAAKEAADSRDFERQIELLESACNLQPRNINLLLGLGLAYGKRSEFASAKHCFERAAEMADDPVPALVIAGGHCLNFKQRGMAEEFFKRAAEHKNVLPIARVGLAEVFELQNRPSDATALIDQALDQDPLFPQALVARARLYRLTGELTKARSVLQALLQRAETKVQIRVEAWCELGRIWDALGDYDAAMGAFQKGKGLVRPPERVFDKNSRLQARGINLEAGISAEDMKRWFDSRGDLQPLGRLAVQGGCLYNCVATPLELALEQHSDVLFLEDSRVFLDEVILRAQNRYFPKNCSMSDIVRSLSREQLQAMRDTYISRNEMFLGEKIGGRLLVEKNHVMNNLLPAMIRVFPEAKFMMMIRDPRDACLSSFTQFMSINPCSSRFFSLEGTIDTYLLAMNHWRTFMSRMSNPIMEVRYEAAVSDLLSVSREVLKFLELNWEADVLRADGKLAGNRKRSALNVGAGAPMFEQPGHWRNYQKYLEPHMKKLEPLVKALGYD
jgi:tetratricopeptide (TPR) repeat protein